MKSAFGSYLSATCWATSTTGPQTRLWQRAGVAKTRTIGFLPRTSAKSTLCIWSGGTRVSIFSRSLPTSAAVSVVIFGGRSPTFGTCGNSPTTGQGTRLASSLPSLPLIIAIASQEPFLVEVDLRHHVDGLRLARAGAVLGAVGGLRLQRFQLRRERADHLRLAVLGEVEGDFDVFDLFLAGREDAEGIAFDARVEDLRGGGDDQLRGGRAGAVQELGDRLALRRRGTPSAGGAGRVSTAAAAAAGEQRRAEGGEREQGGEAVGPSQGTLQAGLGRAAAPRGRAWRLKLRAVPNIEDPNFEEREGRRPGSGPFAPGSATSWAASGSARASGNCRPARPPTRTTSTTPTRSSSSS